MSAAFDVNRILALTPVELANLRGTPCPVDGCNERDCQRLCERGCSRHGRHFVTLPSDESRIVCDACVEPAECSNGCKVPRWHTTVLEGNRFCAKCLGQDVGETW